MSKRFLHLSWLVMPAILVLAVQEPAAGQTSRTAWGDPDLQGVYTFSTPTPMERPVALGRKGTYTDAELAEAEAKFTAQEKARWANEGAVVGTPDTGYDRTVWFPGEEGKLSRRTSLIVEPENGRLPALAAQAVTLRALLDAERRADEASRRLTRTVEGKQVVDELFNSWKDLSLSDRCLARSVPRIGGAYNHGVQIVQTPGFVVVNYEMTHETRVIPLNAPAPDPNVRQWNGVSQGRWEGNTLVVKLSNFKDGVTFQGFPMSDMEFEERFTRVDDKTVDYSVTVNAPKFWAEPWTFILPFRGDDERYQNPEDLYEYACHEGNYRMIELTLTGTKALLEEAKGKD